MASMIPLGDEILIQAMGLLYTRITGACNIIAIDILISLSRTTISERKKVYFQCAVSNNPQNPTGLLFNFRQVDGEPANIITL